MHTIHLRGPWQLEPIERYVSRIEGYDRLTDGLPPSAGAKMPADWSESLGRDFLGNVRYRRTFQKPTGLDWGKRVWLVIDPPHSRGSVVLNDRPLCEVRWGEPPARFDIAALLEDHNRLEIVVEHPVLDDSGVANDDNSSQTPGGLVGEVRLEIEE